MDDYEEGLFSQINMLIQNNGLAMFGSCKVTGSWQYHNNQLAVTDDN